VGEGKNGVTIPDWQKIVFPGVKPSGLGQGLTFGAMSVSTRVIGYLDMSTLVTLANVTAHPSCSTKQDILENSPLGDGQAYHVLSIQREYRDNVSHLVFWLFRSFL
jgi:hypothetical protein